PKTPPAKNVIAGKPGTATKNTSGITAAKKPVSTTGKTNFNLNKNVPLANPLDTVNFGIKPILPKADSLKKEIKKL
ncbi:MAG: hypothetical protein EOP55_21090, partial [Sphingobacteriales bacterium]